MWSPEARAAALEARRLNAAAQARRAALAVRQAAPTNTPHAGAGHGASHAPHAPNARVPEGKHARGMRRAFENTSRSYPISSGEAMNRYVENTPGSRKRGIMENRKVLSHALKAGKVKQGRDASGRAGAGFYAAGGRHKQGR